MLQKEQLDKAFQIVRMKGPVLPVQIVKELGGNTMIAGAILSTLVSNKQVMMSNAKFGGSPVYYVKGQEHKLSILYDKLPEKEKEAYSMLKSKGILRDREQEPAIRVALRQIKDFALPLNVTIQDKTEVFWKWYLMNDENASGLIRNILEKTLPIKEKIQEKPQEIKKQVVEEKIQPKLQIQPEVYTLKKIELFKKELEKREQVVEKPKKIKLDLESKIIDYLSRNNINKTYIEVIRKNREINMVIEIPSKIGSLTFFLKAKDKKIINDSDVILAYNEAQQKKLPVLFLSTGSLTKKAREYMDKNLKGQLLFRSLV